MTDCLFCKIVSGEIPSARVYEDADAVAFLDIQPNNPGHTLLVPKTHARNILDMDARAICAIIPALKKLSHAVKDAVSADGLNIAMNIEPAAGQIVFHAHIHIIPRFSNDGHRHFEKRPYKSEEEMNAVAEKIRAQL
ncbi:MAG: HIT family protein [Parcubacteria group bacterium]|nr:HIT family protein [Parcubacteria group bacterium]MBI3075177.1 HIT family protein [Parcubacteria group bacterium]